MNNIMLRILLKNVSLIPKHGILPRLIIILCLFCVFLHLYKTMIESNKIWSNTFMVRHDLFTNENKKNIRSVYYHQATSDRNSSYPLISGDTYRAFANFVFDETRQDNLALVRYGDIVFLKGDMFGRFFNGPYQSIKNPFILVTHNSDYSAPSVHKSRLEDTKILAWYASNPDIRNHSKLFPIPIGLPNRRWAHGNLTKLMYAFQKHRKLWEQRTTLLYVSFNLNTNREQRLKALSQAEKFQNVQIIKKSVSLETYLEQIGNAKFVLSPPGNGLDCHRTWEALLMGAAPVLLSSGLDPLFNGLPAVTINHWVNLTENRLLSYHFSSYNSLVPVVLYARYWRETIFKRQNKTLQ